MNSVVVDAPPVATANERPAIARFGVFELDLQRSELRRSGARIALQEQPLRLLNALLEKPGELVTREALREKLWPADTFVDFDGGLNAMVRKLRTALDDSADAPRFVETVARHGYRFIAPVEWIRSDNQAATPANSHRIYLWIAALALLIAGVAAVWMLRARREAMLQHAIAVLPFATETQTDFLAETVTQSVIERLSQLPDVRVMAWGTVSRYRAKSPDPKKAGAEMNVGAIVNGTLHRDGDVSRINVELIDTTDGAQLWSRSYEASAGNVAAIHNRIALDLARRVSRQPEALRAVLHHPPRDAYELYAQGSYLLNRRARGDVGKAIELFEAAIARDPRFAAAYTGVAKAYAITDAWLDPPDPAIVSNIKAAAEKAIALDDTEADAWSLLGSMKLNHDWDVRGAERDVKHALEVNPNSSNAHHMYSVLLRLAGKKEEARREMARAYELNPLSPAQVGAVGWSLYYDRDFDEVIAFDRRVTAQIGFGAANAAIRAYLVRGRFDDALAYVLSRPDRDPALFAAARNAYNSHQSRAYFEARARQGLRITKPARETPYFTAMLFAALGNREQALRCLERAAAERTVYLMNASYDPAFDSLRSEPRFIAIMEKMGLARR